MPVPTLLPATQDDAPEVLVLQRCCWVTEAVANGTLDIPPLHEDLGDVRGWIGTAWVLRDGSRLIGGVRAALEGDAWHIGRLMVAPDRRGEGLGRLLLAHIESVAPQQVTRFALFTGAGSTANQALYERAGYRRTGTDGVVVHLEKPRPEEPDLH
ncbi:GNAT family N-acetyltransferase [uncultured Amnibacterium sp.]|uniref:GNAT family N-acetyltransferase n=1 Tax=uncultured Amnibacterium sp. TaxID=1631851 RepID=UPI0035C96E90